MLQCSLEAENKRIGGSTLITRKYMAMRRVRAGMVIDQAIIDRAGRVLVARKSVMDDYTIEALIKMGVPGIYIREGEEDPEEGKQKTPKLSEAMQKK